MNLKTTHLLLFLTSVLLHGCMPGPKYSRPTTPADTNEPFVYAGRHRTDANSLVTFENWWVGFGDSITEQIVSDVLRNNYDLHAAAARVLQADAALAQANAPLFPQANYSLNRTRSKMSFNFGGGRISPLTTTWSQQISVAYTLDFFGRLRHGTRAAWDDLLAAQANRQALTHSLIAAAVKARIDIATARKRLEIARANTGSRRQTLDIVERRYTQGVAGPVDVRLARENLAAAKASEPAIALTVNKAQLALDVLRGTRPGISQPLPETLPDLPALEPINVGLPAALLDRRPDVKAAEMALRAANERIGVSIGQLYPDLTLNASVGRSADRWGDIWKSETEIYSAVMQMAQPIFRGGQLRAQADAAKARYAELAANYAAVVLNAVREVEDALVTEQLLQQQLKENQTRFDEALAAEQLSKQRYQRGVETILTVLESERRKRTAEETLAILKGQIWTTRVNIFLALGGNWTSHEDQYSRDNP